LYAGNEYEDHVALARRKTFFFAWEVGILASLVLERVGMDGGFAWVVLVLWMGIEGSVGRDVAAMM
jgi:hypothetical protein